MYKYFPHCSNAILENSSKSRAFVLEPVNKWEKPGTENASTISQVQNNAFRSISYPYSTSFGVQHHKVISIFQRY